MKWKPKPLPLSLSKIPAILQTLFSRVLACNRMTRRFSNYDRDSLEEVMWKLHDRSLDSIEHFQQNESAKLLKCLIDILKVNVTMLQIMEHLGVDVAGAIDANTSNEVDMYQIGKVYHNMPYMANYTFNRDYGRIVYYNVAGHVVEPVDHPTVDYKQFIKMDFMKELYD